MFVVRKDEQIVCSKAHALGRVTEDILENRPITSNQLRIDFDLAELLTATGALGHACRECHERVTEVRDGSYRIHTARGWVGDFT